MVPFATGVRGQHHVPDPLFYTLLLVSLVWLCVVLHWARPSRCTPTRYPISLPAKPPRKRSKEPTPFAGLTHKPLCALCEQETTHPKSRPPVPPAPPACDQPTPSCPRHHRDLGRSLKYFSATNRHTIHRGGVVHRRDRQAPHAETGARQLHACFCA
jgi:hypothetical protein